MGDVFETVAETVPGKNISSHVLREKDGAHRREVVGRIDLPLRSGTMMCFVLDSIGGKVP